THVELSRSGTWNMTKDSVLDSFRSRGGALSRNTDNWSPKQLTIKNMDASSLHVAMGVSTAGNSSDRVDILNQAKGGHNILDMSSLFDQTVTLKNNLTLASAPTGTSHGYFSFVNLKRGFTVYTPDTQVVEQDGRMLWPLKAPDLPGNNDITDIPPSTPGGSDDPSPEKTGIGGSQPPVTPPGNGDTVVNGDTLFQGKDNAPLLKKARGVLASREYIISNNVGHLEQIIDHTASQNGGWAVTGCSHGNYDAFSVKQSGLDFGFRKNGENGVFWGTAVELYKGNNRASDFRDDYNLWGGSLFAGRTFATGLFVDGSVGYRQLTEDFSIQGELNDLSGKVKSHINSAGIRVGGHAEVGNSGVSITPSVSLNWMRASGGNLRGKERSAELHNGSAFWLKAGVLAEKRVGKLSVSAGLYRTVTLNDMPGVTLSDNWKVRHYAAEKADRYMATLGVEGRATDKLSVQVKLKNSFDGYFKTDCEGQIGLRYEF
ncbi:autotransporter outer membrane beta-barrel domain-containing protein, partial [Salmonella enterica subsp. enterica serovar Bredeney]